MTGEPADTEYITEAVLGEIVRRMDREDAAWKAVYSLYLNYRVKSGHAIDGLIAATSTSVIIFAKAYVETLAKYAGDETIDLLKRMHIRWKRQTNEALIEVDEGAAATVFITEGLPDEARLALLDVDVTAEELRGKLLRWDPATAAWRPSDAALAESDHAVPSDPS
jgi:hypothetical protein